MTNSVYLKRILLKVRSAVSRQQRRLITGASAPSFDLKLPVCASAFNQKFADKIAFTDHQGTNFSYNDLGGKALTIGKEISNAVGKEPTRVSFLCPNDSTFPITLFGAWVAGHAGVPLSEKHPDNLMEYFIKSSQSKVIVTTPEFADRLNPVAKTVGSELVVIDFDKLASTDLKDGQPLLNQTLYDTKDALILFTSGTTGLPKGVLLTHNNLEAQVRVIVDAFELMPRDTLLHTLPLHHTHGLIHALLSPLSVGSRVHMMKKFDAPALWKELLSSEAQRPNVLMAVPTVYTKLVEEFEKSFGNIRNKRELVKATCQAKMRVFVSGSAAIPVPVIEKWEEISGHRILERYGMTEIGIALTNPLRGERKPGYVGNPFESVRIRVTDMTSRTDYKVIAEACHNGTKSFVDKKETVSGDLLVQGPSVFKCYFNNPEATKKEFTDDGWFITGDQVEFSNGSYKILGRKSVDIIKSGGYKLSALEIETQLLSLPQIREVAVMALPDPTWGQKVAAVVAFEGKELTLQEFRDLAKTRLAPYACPQVLKTLKELPRNHLGKVNKKELVKIFDEKPKAA